MLLPKFDLPTRQDTFEVRLLEFMRDEFPALTLSTEKSGPQSHYFIRREGDPVMQVKTVPYTDNKLEVRVSAPLGLREDKYFVQEFYRWAQRAYPKVRISSVVVSLLTYDMMTDPPDEWGDSDKWRHIAEKSLPPHVELMQEPTPAEDGESQYTTHMGAVNGLVHTGQGDIYYLALPEKHHKMLTEDGAGKEEGSSETGLASLHRQLTEARENLRLIQERKSQYVLETDVPLQLVKEKRRLLGHIEKLEKRIEEERRDTRAE